MKFYNIGSISGSYFYIYLMHYCTKLKKLWLHNFFCGSGFGSSKMMGLHAVPTPQNWVFRNDGGEPSRYPGQLPGPGEEPLPGQPFPGRFHDG
jgi:hypothetical protein